MWQFHIIYFVIYMTRMNIFIMTRSLYERLLYAVCVKIVVQMQTFLVKL
jgi:hypothetical protein